MEIQVLIIGITLILVGTILKVTEKIINKKYNIDTPIDEIGKDLENKGNEMLDDISEVNIPNKEIKTKSNTFKLNSIIILLSILFTSCSLFDSAYNIAKDNVEVTWKYDKTKDLKIVDSINVISKPVYFVEDLNSIENGKDYNFQKDGYSIWILKIDNRLRIEVQKLDSLIYLYKPKN